MNKIKAYLEANKDREYTLDDIFIKNNELLLLTPAFLYILLPLLIYIIGFTTMGERKLMASISYPPLVNLCFVVSSVIGIIFISLYFTKNKSTGIKKYGTDNLPNLIFFAYCALMLISSIGNGFAGNTLHSSGNYNETIFTHLCYILIFYHCSSYIRKETYKKAVIYFFMFVSFVTGILVLIDYYIKKIPFFVYISSDGNPVVAMFFNHNHYGYFLTMAVLICAAMLVSEKNKKKIIFSAVSFILNCWILAINDTMGCYLACIVGFAFLVIASSIKSGKFNVKSLVVLIAFFAITLPVGAYHNTLTQSFVTLKNDTVKISTGSDDMLAAGSGRMSLWKETIECIKQKPLFGWGVDGVNRFLDRGDRPHNEYLACAAAFGVVTALTYIAALISIFIRAWKRRKSADNATIACLTASLGYIASAFFGNSKYYIAPFFFIFLGLSNIVDREL